MFKHLSEHWTHSEGPAHTTDAQGMLILVFALCTWFSDSFVQMRFSLFEYFELNNTP